MSSKTIKALALASGLAACLGLAACNSDSDSDDPASKDAKDQKDPAAAKTEKKPKTASDFFKAVDRSLDKTRVKSADEADMYRFKNSETTIFSKERRSDSLLEKNGSLNNIDRE